ncbi:hypothetical protein AAM22_gp28 [Pantoea phage vB_PagM_AAM22]|nr:hypothetical protein AAM22_gp28 [Pantoea phage vB_PagM_AAM22]
MKKSGTACSVYAPSSGVEFQYAHSE